MEASPDSAPSEPGPIFLSSETVENHVQNGQPVPKEKARLIYVMNHLIRNWDNDMGPGDTALPGEW